jgi:acyl-CoA synthetase (AMP-forming)/AMP-acid ligase II
MIQLKFAHFPDIYSFFYNRIIFQVQTQYMCPLLLHSLATHKNRLEHLRNIIVGMAAVSESLIERVLNIYPNIDNFIQGKEYLIYQISNYQIIVYGMTETGIICRTTRISSSPPPQSRCCGHVCANLSIKV